MATGRQPQTLTPPEGGTIIEPQTRREGFSQAGRTDEQRTPRALDGADLADANGVAEIIFQVPPIDGWWEVGLISVTSDSGTPSEARVYVGSVAERNRRAGTSSGNLDDADMQNPIIVPGGSRLIVRWTGASSGALCEATVQAVEVR